MRWTEHIEVDRAVDEVYAAVADQATLMRWSAWPEATGFQCALEGDGTSIGSQIVFRSKDGVEQGRQTLVEHEPGRRVHYDHANRGPGGRTMRPQVDIRLEPLGERRTRVLFGFENTVPLRAPLRQVVDLLMGRRVRALHRKDLEQLKALLETGSPALV